MGEDSIVHRLRLLTLDDDQLLCVKCRRVLYDPMQLDCLHSVCRRCADCVCAAGQTGTMICPKCGTLTKVTSKSFNLFVASQVTLKQRDKCRKCQEEDNCDAGAVVWCRQCRLYLCQKCQAEHIRQNADHAGASLGDSMSSDELSSLCIQPTCTQHGKIFEHFCSTCDNVCCTDCAAGCVQQGHAPRQLRDPETRDAWTKAKDEIKRYWEILEPTSKAISRRLSLLDDLRRAHKGDIDRLKARKKRVLEALDNAFSNAKESLDRSYEKLEEKATELRNAAEKAKQDADHAIQYSKSVVDCDYIVGQLSQQRKLLERLQAIADDISSMKIPADVSKLVHIDNFLPESQTHLEETAKELMGVPRLAANDLCAALEDSEVFNSEMDYTAQVAPHDPLSFTSIGSFPSTVYCCDVAVTTSGHLLLAAKEHGLREFDEDGKQLSSWLPKDKRPDNGGSESITTVDALEDGRVAVDIHLAKCIVLLRRSAGGWQEDKRITAGLQSPPKQLSVHADLLAVAERRWSDFGKQWIAGPDLVILRLRGVPEPHRYKLDYDIQCAIITADGVITASATKLIGSSEQYLVESHSHRGEKQWTVTFSEQVWGICAVPSGRVLYLAMEKSHRVMAVSSRDGRRLKDLVLCNGTSDSSKLTSPARLSLRRGPQAMLAVLGSDWKTVYIYKASHVA